MQEDKTQKDERPRFYLDVSIFRAEKISEATWRVYGPWPQPFHVDSESFAKYFKVIY